MDNVARLFYSVDTRDLQRVDTLLDSIKTSANQAGQSLSNIGASSGTGRRATDEIRGLGTQARATTTALAGAGAASATFATRVSGIGPAIAGIGFVALGREFLSLGTQFTQFNTRIGLVTDSVAEFVEVQDEIIGIAERTRAPLGAVGELYQRIAPALQEAGINQQDILDSIEATNQAIAISGGTAQQNAAAVTQFAQALGSGVLQGDELRSILENAPALATALAEGLSVPVGQLRQLGADGELTTEVIINALLRQREELDGLFDQIPVNSGQAWTLVQNQALVAIGRINDQLGLTAGFSNVLVGLADAIREFGAFALEQVITVQEAFSGIFGATADVDGPDFGEQFGFINDLSDAATRLRSFIEPVLPFIDDFAVSLVAVGAAAAGIAAVTTTLGLLSSVVLSPVALGIAAVAAGAVAIRENWDEFSAFWSGLWDRLQEDVADFNIAGIVETVLLTTIDLIRNAAGAVATAFGNLFSGVVPAVSDGANFAEIAGNIVADIIGGIASGVAGLVTGVRNTFFTLFSESFPNEGDFRSFIVSGLVGLIEGIISFTGTVASALLDLFIDSFPDQGDFFSLVDGMIRGIGNLILETGSILAEVFTTVFTNAFPNEGDFIGFARDLGSSIVDGLVSGLGSIANLFVGWITDGYNAVLEFLGIRSPSLAFREIGGYIVEGLAIGIEAAFGLVRDAFRGLADAVIDAGSAVIDEGLRIGEDIIGGIVDGIGSALDSVRQIDDLIANLFNPAELLREASDLAGEIIEQLVDSISDGASALAQALVQLIRDAIPSVGDIRDGVVEVGQNMVGGITDTLDDGREAVGEAVENLVSAGASVIDRFTPDFFRAGEDLAEGAAGGIASGQQIVADESRQLGVVAEDALRDQTQTQSPSLIFFAIGLDIVDGLVGGIDEGRPAAAGAITSIADEMINRIGDLGDGLIDTLADSFRDFDSLRDALGDIEDFLKDWLGDIAGDFVEQSLGRLFSGGLDSLGSLVGGPSGGGAGASGGILNGIGGFVRGIGDTFEGFTDSFSRVFTSFGDRISGLFGSPVNRLNSQGIGGLSAAASPQPLQNGTLGNTFGVIGSGLAGGLIGLQIGEALDAANPEAVGLGAAIGTGIAGPIGGLIGGLAGSAVGGSRQLVGQGIEVGFNNGVLQGQSFNRFERERALFRGTRTTFEFSELDPIVRAELQEWFDGLNTTIVDSARALGVAGADSILSSFSVEAQRLESEQDIAQFIADGTRDAYQLAFDQITPGLQAIISDSVDVATSPIEDIAAAFDSLGVIASQVVPGLEALGLNLGNNSTQSTINANALVDQLGGIDVALPRLNFVQQEFFPEAGAAAQSAAIGAANSDLVEFSNGIGLFGDNVIDTRQEFATLLTSLDQTTIAGRNTAAQLIDLADEIVVVEDAALAQATAMETVTTIFGRFTPAINGLGTVSQAAVDNLVQAAGGLDELAAGANSFYTNFFTDEERADLELRDATAAVIDFNRQMGFTGDQVIDTRDEFKDLVLDLTAAALAGDDVAASQLATALSLSDSFALVTDSGVDLNDVIAQLPVEMQAGLNGLVAGLDEATEELVIFSGGVTNEFSEMGVESIAEMTALGGSVTSILSGLSGDAETFGNEIQQVGITVSSALTPVEQVYNEVLSPALVGMANQLRQNGQHALAFQAIGLDAHLGNLVAQGVPMSELFNDLPAEFQGIASQLGGPEGLASLLADTSGGAFNAAENVGGFSNALNTAANNAFNASGSISGLANATETAVSGFSRALGRIPKTIEVPQVVLPDGFNGRSPFGGIRSFMTGTDFVDSDGLANIHRGEIIIDPQSSDILRRYGIQIEAPPTVENTDQDQTGELLIDLRAEVRQLREDNARSAQIAANQRDRQRGDIQQQTGEIRELNRESRRQTATLNDAVNNGAP